MGVTGWVVVGVLVLIVLWLIGTYNGLVTLRQRSRQAFSDIDVQLKQRHDLIPNLVETVKGYATHERETLENVIRARNAAVNAQGPAEQAAAENQLSAGLRQLMVLAEAYPDLKANQNFQQLQSELSDIENKIAAARRFFNNVAAEYNATRESFPAVLVAGPLGFAAQDFFNVDETERAAVSAPPQVKF
ncbi:MAG: LemA family protein [Hyphomicrobiaceae bacterium]